MSIKECCRKQFNDCCCCNCENHLEDFHHCTTIKRDEHEGCVCSKHKGWICRMQFEDSDEVFYHSGWSEHGMCEMHIKKGE